MDTTKKEIIHIRVDETEKNRMRATATRQGFSTFSGWVLHTLRNNMKLNK
jgi:hypothetical protein